MHKYIYYSLSVLLLFLSEQSSSKTSEKITEQQIQATLESAARFAGDKANDLGRRPEKILAFINLSKGDHVLDIYAGGGWYTELFSSLVGDDGLVYAHNDELTWRFGGKELSERTKNNRLKNIIRIDQVGLADIKIPEKSVDVAFMGINYHDLYFTHRTRNGKLETLRNENVDFLAAFKNVKGALKDDGVLVVIDHIAKPGSGYHAANTLHRIDPNIVLFELQQVGFELLEEAFYLRNPNDTLDTSVFDPKIRWRTSRFVYKFGKSTNSKL